MRKLLFGTIAFLVVTLGCSSSTSTDITTTEKIAEKAAEKAPAATPPSDAIANATGITVGATLPTVSTTPKTPNKIVEKIEEPSTEKKESPPTSSDASTPVPDIGDLFAPPKVVVPVVTREPVPEPKPEPTPTVAAKQTQLPPLQLLGFVEVEGLKALLSVDGKLNVITMGDSVDGIKLIAVEPPSVTLHYEEQDFTINLFEQPWFHQTDEILNGAKTFGGKPVRSHNPLTQSPPGRSHVPPIPSIPNARSSTYPAPPTGIPGMKPNGIPSLPAPPSGNGGPPALPSIQPPSTAIPGLPNLTDSSKPNSENDSTTRKTKKPKANPNDDD